MRTKMAVFFEGLEHRLWITTLRLGVTGEKLGTIVLECYMAVFFGRTRTQLRQHAVYLLALSFDRIRGEKWHLAKDI